MKIKVTVQGRTRRGLFFCEIDKSSEILKRGEDGRKRVDGKGVT